MSSNLCVVGIGEVLMDVFENGEATLGGAPFNVAFHVHQLLTGLSMGEAVFVSAVGQDHWGKSIRAVLAEAGISDRLIANVDKETGKALVFESNGDAGFEIKADVAWDYIRLNRDAVELAQRCNAVAFGSLAQRAEVSRTSVREFVSAVRGHRLYDVNLRRNTTNGVAGYSAEIVEESLRLATLVKMNDAELDEVCGLVGLEVEAQDAEEHVWLSMDRLRRQYALDGVAITCGARGALLAWGETTVRLSDSILDQALVHPVGAGDAFAAGLLFGVLQGWTPQESMELANILSSWVVRHVSATPQTPDEVLAKVRALMGRASLIKAF